MVEKIVTGFAYELLPIEKVKANPQQPRKEFDEAALQELAGSIKEHGVIEPILVEAEPGAPGGEGTYLLQAGERRLRAARMAGLREIPAVIRPSLNGSGARERLVVGLVENLMRADMNPIEEANGYAVLKNDPQAGGLSQVEIAHQVGVPLSRVTRRMVLLKLEKETQELVKDGRLSDDPRVIVALLDLDNKSDQVKVATGLAARRAGPKAALEVISRFQEHVRGEKFEAEVIPAKRMAFRKGEPNKTQWNALQQVGKLPPWLLVEISARDVCEMCSLRDQASPTTCRGCALVEMLVTMIGKANNPQKGGGHGD
jgi:ParB family chromosome partitioning protein